MLTVKLDEISRQCYSDRSHTSHDSVNFHDGQSKVDYLSFSIHRLEFQVVKSPSKTFIFKKIKQMILHDCIVLMLRPKYHLNTNNVVANTH